MILKGTGATLRASVYVDGTLTALSDNGTVTVVDESGTTVATGSGASGGTGIMTFPLTPTHTASPNKLTITWSGLQIADGDEFSIVTTEEVVGDLLFTEAAARAHDGGALSNTSKYSDEAIAELRDSLQEEFGRIIGVSLGLRGEREVLSGPGSRELMVSRWPLHSVRVVSVRTSGTQTWTAFTSDELADVLAFREGTLKRETMGSFAKGDLNIAVTYEHGLHPIPQDLRRAGLMAARALLVRSNIDDRALFLTNELGQMRLAVAEASRSHWYGVPNVDSVLQRYRETYRVGSMGVG